MNLISRVWSALASLAGNLEALSATVAEANTNARTNLGLPPITPALTDASSADEAGEPATKKGRGTKAA